MRLPLLLAFTLGTLCTLGSMPGMAAVYQVGPGRQYTQLTAVAGLLNPGDIVEVDGNATYNPVTFTRAGTAAQPILIRGIRINGNRPRIHGSDTYGYTRYLRSVVGQTTAQVGFYTFEGIEISGGSQACVRSMARDLTFRDVKVSDCARHGILSHDYNSGNLTLDYVEVTATGGIYAGENVKHPIYITTSQDTLPGSTCRVTHSYIHHNRSGNNIKSRCERNEIYYNWIEGAEYYELELIGPEETGTGRPGHSDVVGNVLLGYGGYPIRLGSDGHDESRGRYRFVNNTIIAMDPGWGGLMRHGGAIESVELTNNIFYSGSSSSGARLYRADTWLHGEVITGSNNWISSTVETIPAGLTGTVQGSNPGFANVSSGAAFDPRLVAGAAAIDRASLLTTFSNPYPVPNALLLPQHQPTYRMSVDFTSITTILRLLTGIMDLGAFEARTGGSTTGDVSAPSVAITSPTAGASVSGSINVSATASDNIGVTGVQFLLDGSSYGPEQTGAPYTATINTTTLTNGNHTIAARARDAAGNQTSSAVVTFAVNNAASTGPAISAIAAAPTGTTAVITWITSEPSTSQVQYGVTTGYGSTSPLNSTLSLVHSVSLPNLTAGTLYHFRVLSRDSDGNVATSPDRTFTTTSSAVDTTRPTVSMISPTAGQTLSGAITASANATDAGGIAGVQFLVDGQPWGTEDTLAPYSIAITTTALSNSIHTIAARARDKAGNITNSTAITVTIANTTTSDKTPPAVSMMSPAGGQTLSGTITASANATDAGGIAGVQFLVDGQPWGTEDTLAPYSIAITTTALSNSIHTIAARARDKAGNITNSTAITVTIANTTTSDKTPPAVILTSPLSGTTISGTITASAYASDVGGIAGVQFLVDGMNWGTEDRSAPYTIAINTAALSNKMHTIAARARDMAGNVTTSPGVAITIKNISNRDTTPPSVTMTWPYAGKIVYGTLTATANATDAGGIAGVQFLVDGQPWGAEDRSAPYSIAINTIALSNNIHTIAARARDTAGNTTTSSAVTVTINNDE